MKAKYYFVRKAGGLTAGITIYHVWVGTSQREQTKKKLVEEFCKDNSLPFTIWGALVDSLIDQFTDKFKADGCKYAKPYRTASVSISQLYRMIIDDSFERFEANNLPSAFEIYINHYSDPEYIQRQNKKSSDTSCQPPHAENLSLRRNGKASMNVSRKTA